MWRRAFSRFLAALCWGTGGWGSLMVSQVPALLLHTLMARQHLSLATWEHTQAANPRPVFVP